VEQVREEIAENLTIINRINTLGVEIAKKLIATGSSECPKLLIMNIKVLDDQEDCHFI
jgi:hypothetical protein